jgi:hypothetical protein
MSPRTFRQKHHDPSPPSFLQLQNKVYVWVERAPSDRDRLGRHDQKWPTTGGLFLAFPAFSGKCDSIPKGTRRSESPELAAAERCEGKRATVSGATGVAAGAFELSQYGNWLSDLPLLATPDRGDLGLAGGRRRGERHARCRNSPLDRTQGTTATSQDCPAFKRLRQTCRESPGRFLAHAARTGRLRVLPLPGYGLLGLETIL